MPKIRYVESNIPSSLRVRVNYVSRYRHPEQLASLPKWHTTATLIDKNSGAVVARATSSCNETDQPVRKIGRAVAVGRAFKSYYKDRYALQSV